MEEKKPIYKKWWFWVIIVIVLISLIGSGGSSDNTTVTPSGEATNTTGTQQETHKTVNVGEKYQDNYIGITYVSLNDNFTEYSKYADIKSGYKVIRAEFEFENFSSSDEYVSSYDFNCYADGYECQEFYSVDDSSFGATLSTGKKAKGAVYFEVPQNASKIELEYTVNSWTSEKIIFVVK